MVTQITTTERRSIAARCRRARRRYEARRQTQNAPLDPTSPSTTKPRKWRKRKSKRLIIDQMVAKCHAMPDTPRAYRYARTIANKMIEFGFIARAAQCQREGCTNPDATEIHHDNYLRPRDIQFLCRECRCGIERAKAKALHLRRCEL